MITKLFDIMKNTMLIGLLCLTANYLFGQDNEFDNLFEPKPNLIEKIEQPFSGQEGTFKKNHFAFKVNKRNLRNLEPISPGQRPGWSYFWNYGDGNFYITTEELGEIYHTYTENDTFLLRVEGTPIKTPIEDEDEESENRIILDTNSIIIAGLNSFELSPSKKNLTTKVEKEKSVQLLSSRCAVSGDPFTIIVSAEDKCSKQSDNNTIIFSFNNKYIEYVDTLENYHRDPIEHSKSDDGDSIIYEITLLNQKRKEQRNYFANFRTKPDIEIGKEIKFIAQYINNCDTFFDTLILETAKSHDPSFKLMTFSEAIKNCEIPTINELDVFIHFENDGEGNTSTISIVDSIVPSLKIDTVISFISRVELGDNLDFSEEHWDDCKPVDNTEWETYSTPITTILHTPDNGCLILTENLNTNYIGKLNDTITIFFDSIKLKGKKSPDYLTKFPPIETMDEVKFKVIADGAYSSPFFCNIADIYFDENEAESVFDCVFYSCDCDSLMRIKRSILKGSCTIELGKDTVLSSDYSQLDFTPDKYIWWPDEETDSIITVSPTKDKLYMVAASYCDTETGIEQYVIGRKIVYIKRPGNFQANLIIDTIIVQHVSCFDSLDGSFQLKMAAGNYSLKWNDLRKKESFENEIVRDSMANGTYFYTITKYDTDTLTYSDSVTINEPPPLFFEYNITKTSNTTPSLYNIASIVYGGVPDYEITWKLDNGNIANTYNVNSVGAGTYIVEVKDRSNWVRRDTIEIPDCDILQPVLIPDDFIGVCAGQPAIIYEDNDMIVDGFEQFFVLHNGDLKSVIDFNKDGRFLNEGTYVRNEELYVSSIIVPVDGKGDPDFDYFCANIDLKSTPIVFYEPIKIDADVICYKYKCTFDVVFSITGGAADYSPDNMHYTIVGDYHGTVSPGNQKMITRISDGSNYEIHVIDDGSGWGSQLISEPIQCCKLPIELLHFTGKEQKAGNLLEWATATEIENDYFTIAYSKDGVEFEELHKVNGQGTSSSSHNYQYLHQNPVSELNYYKLSQTDRDGTINDVGYVNVIRSENEMAVLTIYPNPANDMVQLVVESEKLKNGKLIIYNSSGDKLYESESLLQTNINIENWRKGIYLVQVKFQDRIITKKLIKY